MIKQCACCETEFEAFTRVKFCSKTCWKFYTNAKRRKGFTIKSHECVECGGIFTGHPNAKTCSEKCRKIRNDESHRVGLARRMLVNAESIRKRARDAARRRRAENPNEIRRRQRRWRAANREKCREYSRRSNAKVGREILNERWRNWKRSNLKKHKQIQLRQTVKKAATLVFVRNLEKTMLGKIRRIPRRELWAYTKAARRFVREIETKGTIGALFT